MEVLKKMDKIWEFKRRTLILDLDHTLVKTSRHELNPIVNSEDLSDENNDSKLVASPEGENNLKNRGKNERKKSKKGGKTPKNRFLNKKKNFKDHGGIRAANIKLNLLDQPDITLHCYFRPYLEEFLDKVSFDIKKK
jgi:hypothetical protein